MTERAPVKQEPMPSDDRFGPEAGNAAPTSTELHFTAAEDVMNAAPPVEIVESLAWAGSLSILVSESGTGKTFVLLDVSAAVDSGATWHGRRVEQGSVAYLSYEGDALGLRLRALREAGRSLEHLYVLRAHDPLSPRVGRDGAEERSLGEITVAAALKAFVVELRTTGRPPIRLIVIDTVRASLTGSEDSSDHVSGYLRAVRRIVGHAPEAAIILAHHAGWQDGENARKRERGSSAWRGNCDATLYLEAGSYDATRGEAPLTLRTIKVRDGEPPGPLHFVRRRVDLELAGRDGAPLSSCIIAPDSRSREHREADRAAAVEASLREIDQVVLKAMRDYPAATSISKLRPYVGLGSRQVQDAVARLLRGELAVEGKRGHPFVLTPAGLAQLTGGDS
jgi:hypothetical protein